MSRDAYTDEYAARVTAQVEQLYDAYPFPGEPLSSEPPPGWNWRWSWPQAYSFCTGAHPGLEPPRILDAGCGSGAGTEYIAHQNPEAEIWAFDLSEKALSVAQERCRLSQAPPVKFRHLSLYDVERIPGQFQFVNCVGVLHHLPDPTAGLQALAQKLVPGGIMHVFVYGELGRWEIRLMQKALRLLVGGDESLPLDSVSQLQAGLRAGRQLFDILPDSNRILQQERERWAAENRADENFADMYLHPQEEDFSCPTLFPWIEGSGLEFLGFSNPQFWQLERLLGKQPELLQRAQQLSPQQQYRLVELLDPVVAHYEFYLGRPPLSHFEWHETNIADAIAHLSTCLWYWPSPTVLNYAFESVKFTEAAYQFLQQVDGRRTIAELQQTLPEPLPWSALRDLLRSQVLLLQPAATSQHYLINKRPD
jgi:SAM-dependent methyltransferase